MHSIHDPNFEGSAADKARIFVGDEVLSLNDHPVDGLTHAQAQALLNEANSEGLLDLRVKRWRLEFSQPPAAAKISQTGVRSRRDFNSADPYQELKNRRFSTPSGRISDFVPDADREGEQQQIPTPVEDYKVR